MSFPVALAPVLGVAAAPLTLGLVAAGLVSIPIIIHLLNRRRFKVVSWAAMDYLLRAMRQNRKRMKFEQWLLLLTRCAVMLLFFLGFAWLALLTMIPAGCAKRTFAAVGGRSGLNVFVIDNSYSTAYEAAHEGGAKTHLEHEKRIAKRVIDQLNSGGESVAVFVAARPATPVIGEPGFDLNAAKAAVDRIEQSYSSTDLAGALNAALTLGRKDNSAVKNLYVLTDATRSAWAGNQAEELKRLGPELAKVFRVTHFNMTEGRQQANQAVVSLDVVNGLANTKFDTGTQLSTVAHAYGAGGPEPALRWTLDGAPIADTRTAKGPGKLSPSADAVLLPLDPHQLRTGGAHVITATLGDGQGGDALKVDNKRHRVVEVANDVRVLIVEGTGGTDPEERSGTTLHAALSPPEEDTGGTGEFGTYKSDSYVAPEAPISDQNLSDKVLNDYRAIALCGVGQFSDKQADALQHFVANGGTLLVFMGEAVRKDNYNDVLLPRKLLPGPLIKRMQDDQGFTFDFKPAGVHHPFLQMFGNEENTGLDTARTFIYWQVDVPADSKVERVLNYLTPADRNNRNGSAAARSGPLDPAITVHSLGQGRVVFFATSANAGKGASWTSFTAKPAYVELMNEILAHSIRSRDYWMNLAVGQSLQIPPEVKVTRAPELKDENGTPILIDPVTDTDPVTGRPMPDRPPVYKSRPLNKPGVYALNTGNANVPIAVNVPAADEADVRTVGNDEVRKALGGIPIALQGDALPAENSLLRDGSDWAGYILLGVLALLGLECFMAMTFGHYRRAPAVVRA